MASRKGQESVYIRLIEQLLCDIQNTHSEVYTPRSCSLDRRKLVRRYEREGIGLLTKTLPRLGKSLDRALSGEVSLNCTGLRLKTQKGSKLPKLFGELFQRILSHDGWILPTPCVKSIKLLRQLTLVFYKLELDYSPSLEQSIIDQFILTENEIIPISSALSAYAEALEHGINPNTVPRFIPGGPPKGVQLADRGPAHIPEKECNGVPGPVERHGSRSIRTMDDGSDVRNECFPRILGGNSTDVCSEQPTQRRLHRQRSEGLGSLSDERASAAFERLLGLHSVIRKAKILLQDVFALFDPRDIRPKHGPGVVSTKETLWEKYLFRSIPDRILQQYPLDPYFGPLGQFEDYARTSSVPHLFERGTCGRFDAIDHPARVLLVPKDSRGPRLISCEPLVNQWIQQGIFRAMVRLVESHPLTRYNVHFTDQRPNQLGALLGSQGGKYATLDLKEASDRVSIGLVRLLFPSWLTPYLFACRSEATTLPSGEVLKLEKFAPMGSALCFPVMALSIWSILTAGLSDAKYWRAQGPYSDLDYGSRRYVRPRQAERTVLLVYGDDVIVPTAQAANAIELLESFGLAINRDKSCTSGLFRESCGTDAFAGVEVQPVRIRTPWHHDRRPEVLASWVSYANSMYRLKFYQTYDYIVDLLGQTYGQLMQCEPNTCITYKDPLQMKDDDWFVRTSLALIEVPEKYRVTKSRSNPHLQKREWLQWTLHPRKVSHEIDGWSSLFRFFVEQEEHPSHEFANDIPRRGGVGIIHAVLREPFSVSVYTKRREVKLRRCWR